MMSDNRAHPRLPVSQALLRAPFLLPVLTATLVLTACHLDRLVDLPNSTVDRFSFPLRDSAQVGSTIPRSSVVRIAGKVPGQQWNAKVTHSSAWLILRDSSGTTPDTLHVEMDPTTLLIGSYQDTIVVTVSNEAVPIPVEFLIHP